jgi:hypothetical protein
MPEIFSLKENFNCNAKLQLRKNLIKLQARISLKFFIGMKFGLRL